MVLTLFLVAGVALGLAAGGSLSRLGDLRIAWAPLAVAGLAVQVVLFSPAATGWIGSAGPPVYVASTVAVLAVLLRNVRLAGLPAVALGAALNLAVILANGGYMPVSAAARAAVGDADVAADAGYGNTTEMTDSTPLAPAGDVIPVPGPPPLGTVVSIGDVLIGVGGAWFLVRGMRPRTLATAA